MNEDLTSFVKKESPLILLLLLFIGVRVYYLLSGGIAIDSDEAIIGLMGKHILAGQRPVFFYGQEYMGSLEGWLSALVFSFCGVSSWSLKAVPFLFAIVFFLLSVHLARVLYGRLPGLLTAFFLVFSSPFFLIWSLKARGGYIETLVFGTILFLLARRILSTYTLPVNRAVLTGITRNIRCVVNWLMVLICILLFFQLMQDGITLQFGEISLSSRGFVRPVAALCICWLVGYFLCKGEPVRISRLMAPYWRNMALFGLVAGLSWWTNQLILLYLIPVGCVLVCCLRSSLRTGDHQLYFAATFIAFFFMGSAPYWLYRMLHGFSGSGVIGFAEITSWLQQGKDFFIIAIPRLLGCWFNFSADPLVAGCSVFVLILYGLSLLFLVRRLLAQWLSGGVSGIDKVEVILFLFLCCYPVFFSISSMGWFTSEPRYLLPLFSVLPLVTARFFAQVQVRSTGLLVFLLTPFFLLSLFNVIALDTAALQPWVKNRLLPVSFAPLKHWLNENQIKYAYTEYWIAYRLTFESNEEIICSVYPPFVNERYPLYSELTGKSNRPAYIIMKSVSPGFEVMLEDMGISQYQRKELPPFVIYYDLEIENRDESAKKIILSRQHLTALPSEQSADLAIDGNLNTRWQAQKERQRKRSSFQIDLGRIAYLRYLDIVVGNFPGEIPKSLRVEISEQGKGWELIRLCIHPEDEFGFQQLSHPLGYWLSRLRICIDEQARFVRLSPLPAEERWSLTEIEIFEDGSGLSLSGRGKKP